MRPRRRQPTRLRHLWDSPGKNAGVGCHFLLQCMKVKSESEVVQSCPTLRDPMDRSLPGSSSHGIFQARVLEWGAIAFSVHDLTNASVSCLTCTTAHGRVWKPEKGKLCSAAPQVIRYLLGAEEGHLPKHLPRSALTWAAQ